MQVSAEDWHARSLQPDLHYEGSAHRKLMSECSESVFVYKWAAYGFLAG